MIRSADGVIWRHALCALLAIRMNGFAKITFAFSVSFGSMRILARASQMR